MSIKIPDPNNEGEEIEVFTQDEIATQLAERDTKLEEATKEVERYKRVAAEQGENFKKLSDMTADEKAKFSTEQIENMKRVEAAEQKVKDIEERYSTDTQNRIKADKENALKRYHGGDEALKKALEENYELINLPGDDTATIFERARLASAMEAGKSGARNPLMTHYGGGAPSTAQKTKTDEFLGSDKAKKAEELMNNN